MPPGCIRSATFRASLGRVERPLSRCDPRFCPGRYWLDRRGRDPSGRHRDIYRRAPAPANSINFVTCHDGFTLHDLVSYDDKHNEANGEDNRDGRDHNLSWNCGAEGETDDAAVRALRAGRRRI